MDLLNLSFSEVWPLLLIGGFGALVAECLDDGALQMPKISGGKIFLGFFGALIAGAAVGLIVDHSPITAFFAGFTGYSSAGALLGKKAAELSATSSSTTSPTTTSSYNNTPAAPVVPATPLSISDIIIATATHYGVDTKLALAVAKCESGLRASARNKNTDGSVDRGIYQINDKWHPDVSTTQADDPAFAAEFFCKAVKAGNLSWWNASKPCWGVALIS